MELLLTDTEAAYIAGLLDGEGSIALGTNIDKRRQNEPVYRLRVRVAMTDKPTIEWLAAKVGEPIRLHKRAKLATRDAWGVSIEGDRAAVLLQRCLPYFITKLEHARLGIAFMDLRRWRRLSRMSERDALGRFGATPKALQQEFDRMLDVSRRLNRRGSLSA